MLFPSKGTPPASVVHGGEASQSRAQVKAKYLGAPGADLPGGCLEWFPSGCFPSFQPAGLHQNAEACPLRKRGATGSLKISDQVSTDCNVHQLDSTL